MRHGPDCECTPCCDRDAAREQPHVYAAQHAEYRRHVDGMTMEQRAVNCGHLARRRGPCPDCGEYADP